MSKSGGVRIERAAMTDLFDLKTAADRVHDIVRSRAGGFINENRAVECGKILHENYRALFNAFFTAAMTLR